MNGCEKLEFTESEASTNRL